MFFAAFLFLDIWAVSRPGGQWGGFEWVRETASQIAFLVAALAVVAIQYAARRIALARAVASTAIAVCSLVVSNAGWHTAFALTSALAGTPDEASRHLQVAFDPSVSPATMAAMSGRVSIPVRVAGIPHGHELLSERVSVVIKGSGAATWNSGWRDRNELANRSIWRNSDDWLAGDGQYWLSFDVPATYLETVKNKPARLWVAIALSEFTSPVITKLPPHPRQYPVPEVGHCSLDTVAVLTMISCVAPFERRSAVDFHILPHSGAKAWKASGCCISTYGPLSSGGSFGVWSDVGSMPSGPQLSPGDEVSVEMRRPVSFFEREVVIADIQLARYEVGQ